jgi:hypothetical protein
MDDQSATPIVLVRNAEEALVVGELPGYFLG